jgi:hypothetical protein
LAGANLHVATETRQYSLLALLVAYFIYAVLRFLHQPTKRSFFILFPAAALGMLSHYHFFLLPLCVGFVILLSAIKQKTLRMVILYALALIAAFALFVVLHPSFMTSFSRQAIQAQPFSWLSASARIQTSLRSILMLFMSSKFATNLANLFFKHTVLLWTVVIIILFIIRKRLHIHESNILTNPKIIPSFCMLLCLSLILLLYISCRSPKHAMGTKYLMLISPLLFISIGQAISFLFKYYRRTTIFLAAAFLVSQTTYGIHSTIKLKEYKQRTGLPPQIARQTPIVIDTEARGIVPAVLWHVHPNTPVYVANQSSMLTDSQPDLTQYKEVLYISVLRYQNTSFKRNSLMRSFEKQGLTNTASLNSVYGVGNVFLLTNNSTPQ